MPSGVSGEDGDRVDLLGIAGPPTKFFLFILDMCVLKEARVFSRLNWVY